MRDLTLVGLTEDKTNLLLVSDTGEEYALPVDAHLRAALRGDHARPGQLEIKMDSALRPRDIQARIRAGATPESVAEAAQTTVDRIMGYAMPVLAERAHIAERAQRSSVRRKASEGPARLLGDAVAERLRERNVDPDAVDWDAWRREDGRWTLVADYRADEDARHAQFTFDAPGRYVVPEDDEARWLVGEQSAARAPQQPPAKPAGRRLTAVPDEELPLGDDAIGLVTGDADWFATQADAPAARAETGPSAEDDGDNEPTVPLRKQTARVPAPEAPAPESEPPAAAAEPDDARDAQDAGDADAPLDPGTPDESEEQGSRTRPAKKSSRKNKRASVPSWDEIMFGGGRSD